MTTAPSALPVPQELLPLWETMKREKPWKYGTQELFPNQKLSYFTVRLRGAGKLYAKAPTAKEALKLVNDTRGYIVIEIPWCHFDAETETWYMNPTQYKLLRYIPEHGMFQIATGETVTKAANKLFKKPKQ